MNTLRTLAALCVLGSSPLCGQRPPAWGLVTPSEPSGVNPKFKPDISADAILLRLGQSDSLWVLGCTAGWCQVLVGAGRSDTAYVRTQELVLRLEGGVRPWFAVRPVRLYMARDTARGSYRTLSPGDTVWVTGCMDEWCEVSVDPSLPLPRLYAERSLIDTVVNARSIGAARGAFELARARRLVRMPAGKWRVHATRSEMDESRTVTIQVDAENVVQGRLYSRRPTLIIRCRDGKTDLYVLAGVPAQTEYGLGDEVTVRWRLDEKPVQAERWSESTDYLAFFSPDPIPLALQIAESRTMRFEFTRFQSTPAVVRFDTRGLPRHLGRIARTCGWRYEP